MNLQMPTIGGAPYLRLLLEDIPRAKWSGILGVTDRTVRRWLTEEAEIPSAVFHALFWYSRWGDSLIQSTYGFELSTLRGMARADGEKIFRLAALPAANAPTIAPALRRVR